MTVAFSAPTTTAIAIHFTHVLSFARIRINQIRNRPTTTVLIVLLGVMNSLPDTLRETKGRVYVREELKTHLHVCKR